MAQVARGQRGELHRGEEVERGESPRDGNGMPVRCHRDQHCCQAELHLGVTHDRRDVNASEHQDQTTQPAVQVEQPRVFTRRRMSFDVINRPQTTEPASRAQAARAQARATYQGGVSLIALRPPSGLDALSARGATRVLIGSRRWNRLGRFSEWLPSSTDATRTTGRGTADAVLPVSDRTYENHRWL
jgi:hypothetical protein